MRSALLLSALLLLGALPSAAQTSEEVLLFSQRQPVFGAQLAGQGGASIGGVGAWTAAQTNPASLGWLRTSQASASLDFFRIDNDAFYRLSDADVSAGFASSTLAGDIRSSGTRLGHAGYAAKVPTVRGSFVVGIGYTQVASYDRALFYDVEVSDVTVVDRFEEDLFEEGQAGELSAAGALEVAPGVMAGASVNVLIGSYALESVAEASFFEANPDVLTFDVDTRGVNARFGLSAEAGPGLRLGVMAETPSYVAVREQGVDDLAGVLPLEYDYTTPWRFGAGAVYEIAGALLAADVEYVDWSQARIRTDGFSAAEDLEFIAEQNNDIRRNFDDAFTTRLGAAYDLGIVTVRGGLAYQPDPLRDAEGVVADRLRRTVTAGVGIRLGRSSEASLALINTQYENQTVAVDGLGLVLEDVSRTALVAGVTFNF